jgi:succinoglycan biosynthesis transport protein ExoP
MSQATGMMPHDPGYPPYPRQARFITSSVPELVLDPVTSISMSEIWRIARRNLWWIAIATFLAIVGVAIVLRYVPPTYRATAVLQVAARLPPIPSDFPSAQQSVAIDDIAVNSEVDAVLAVPVLNHVIQDLQLEGDPEFNPILAASMPSELWPPLAAVWGVLSGLSAQIQSYLSPRSEARRDIEHRLVEQKLEEALSVSIKNRSRVIVVQALSESPKKAAAIANAVARAFLQNRFEAKVEDGNQISAWLDERLAELRSRMGRSEQDVQRMRTTLGHYKGMNATLLSEQLSQINRQLIDAEADLSVTRSKFEQIERLGRPGEDIGAANDVLTSPLIRNLRLQRQELITQRGEKLALLGRRHPDMINLNSQLAQVDRAISTEIGRISKNATDELKVRQARVAALEQAKRNLEQRMSAQNIGLVDAEQLQRDADTDRKAYEAFAVYRAKIAGLNAVQPEAELLSPAISPLHPAYPRKLLILAAAGFVTLLLSAILAFVRENLDQRFRSAQDVAAILGLRTLALVPRVAGHRHPENYVRSAPQSAVAESIRYLYAELDRASPESTPFKVLVTSSIPDEGKSTTATMLAREAALNGRKTLLVNLDIRHSEASKDYEWTEGGDVQRLRLSDQPFERSITVEPTTDLARLSFHTMLCEPFKLLCTREFWSELSTITSDYELVIIDSPPILSVPDAKVIAAFAHTTVFLIKWASTKHQTASEGLRHFRAAGANICGAVLAQVDPKKYAQYEDNYVRGYLGSSKESPASIEL